MEEEDLQYCDCPFYSVNALSRIMTKIADDAFMSVGMSSSYAFLMVTVNDKPGINPKELCKMLQLTPSTVTRLIEKLEVRGLLERRQEGRVTHVFPTEAGLAMQEDIKKAWASLYSALYAAIGDCEELRLSLKAAVQRLS